MNNCKICNQNRKTYNFGKSMICLNCKLRMHIARNKIKISSNFSNGQIEMFDKMKVKLFYALTRSNT